MKPHRLLSPLAMRIGLLIKPTFALVILANTSSTCAQDTALSLRQRIATRVASEKIFSVVFQGKNGVRHTWSLPDLTLETRLAIVFSSSTSEGWNDTWAKIIENNLEVVALLSKESEDLDRAIMVSAKYASDDSELRAAEKKLEISFNQLVTPAWAANAALAEQAIRSSVGPKLKAAQDRLAAAYLARFAARPELLKPFVEEKPASDELKKSRAAVKALIDEARKKSGR